MLPSILMLLDWAASGVSAATVYATHYRIVEGPSRKTHQLVGPSAEYHVLEGPSGQLKTLAGSQ